MIDRASKQLLVTTTYFQDQSQIRTAWDFVPSSGGGWVKFAISVNRGGFASLHTACGRQDTKSFHRDNQEMEVKDEDMITIGKAHILGRAFFVSFSNEAA